jgi:signal transduction histidine kinase
MLHSAGEERRRQLASWLQRSEKLSQMAQREEEEIIGDTHQLLLAVAESSAVQSDNLKSCKKLLDELLVGYPRYANLGVLTPTGEPFATALPLEEPTNQSDRRFFKRAVETRSFAIGDFPSRNTNSRPMLSFGCPVLEGGQVRSVVFAALDLQWFNHVGSDLPAQITAPATWTEIDRKGTILARYPEPDLWNGRRLPEPGLLEAILKRPSGMLEAPDQHGDPNLYVIRSVSSQFEPDGVIMVLGIPKESLFAEANRELNRNLTWLALAAAVALTVGGVGSSLLILRPVKALVKSTARLARGELSARTGLPHGHDELGQLTLAFDQMAEALEQREIEHERASNRLHVLSQRLVEVQENERRQIARELHDEIGQTLTSAEMNLQAALRTPGAISNARRLEDSIQAVERVLEQVHDLSLSLRPSMLDDLGLEPALRWYTQRQATLAGLQAEFRAAPMEDRMDPVIETECFRVAQEAINNVLRHAKAQAVSVELSQNDKNLHLSVRDDGVGFDVSAMRQEAVNGASLGLLSMEERATLAGGGIEYHSAPGRGTEIHAWFPLIWKTEHLATVMHE